MLLQAERIQKLNGLADKGRLNHAANVEIAFELNTLSLCLEFIIVEHARYNQSDNKWLPMNRLCQ